MLGWKDFIKIAAPYMPMARGGINPFVDPEGAPLPRVFNGGQGGTPITREGVEREYQWSKDRDAFKQEFGFDPVERNRIKGAIGLAAMHPLTWAALSQAPGVLAAGAKALPGVATKAITTAASNPLPIEVGTLVGAHKAIDSGNVWQGLAAGLGAGSSAGLLSGYGLLPTAIGQGASKAIETADETGSVGQGIKDGLKSGVGWAVGGKALQWKPWIVGPSLAAYEAYDSDKKFSEIESANEEYRQKILRDSGYEGLYRDAMDHPENMTPKHWAALRGARGLPDEYVRNIESGYADWQKRPADQRWNHADFYTEGSKYYLSPDHGRNVMLNWDDLTRDDQLKFGYAVRNNIDKFDEKFINRVIGLTLKPEQQIAN